MKTLSNTDQTHHEALILAHQRGVWLYLRSLGCDAALADDLTQETFVYQLEKPWHATFAGRSDAERAAYLRNAARLHFLSRVRKEGRREELLKAEARVRVSEAVWQELLPDDDPQGYRAALRRCLDTIEARWREALDLAYADKASSAEIAQHLNLKNAAAANALMYRARKRLKRCIEKRVAAAHGENDA